MFVDLGFGGSSYDQYVRDCLRRDRGLVRSNAEFADAVVGLSEYMAATVQPEVLDFWAVPPLGGRSHDSV
jgi:hypothetical protein